MTLRSIRCALAAVLIAAAAVVATPSASAQSYWFESYERAVGLVHAGRFAEASTLLEDVLERQPAPIAALRVPGARFIDYVPYHFRARIDLALGDTAAASHHLDVSVAFGEPTFSRECERATAKLREAIAARQANSRAADDPAATRIHASSARVSSRQGEGR